MLSSATQKVFKKKTIELWCEECCFIYICVIICKDLAPKMIKNQENLALDNSKNLGRLAQTLKIFCDIPNFFVLKTKFWHKKNH
uniref:Uncharacterized protein n=1 Tax=Romanomermis culicivorax TaxID=13658 RepID=A0A915IJ24_ROMCU